MTTYVQHCQRAVVGRCRPAPTVELFSSASRPLQRLPLARRRPRSAAPSPPRLRRFPFSFPTSAPRTWSDAKRADAGKLAWAEHGGTHVDNVVLFSLRETTTVCLFLRWRDAQRRRMRSYLNTGGYGSTDTRPHAHPLQPHWPAHQQYTGRATPSRTHAEQRSRDSTNTGLAGNAGRWLTAGGSMQ